MSFLCLWSLGLCCWCSLFAPLSHNPPQDHRTGSCKCPWCAQVWYNRIFTTVSHVKALIHRVKCPSHVFKCSLWQHWKKLHQYPAYRAAAHSSVFDKQMSVLEFCTGRDTTQLPYTKLARNYGFISIRRHNEYQLLSFQSKSVWEPDRVLWGSVTIWNCQCGFGISPVVSKTLTFWVVE